MDNSGWIKLHRSFLDWEWWEDHNTTRLFLYLLIAVNHKERKWKGIVIERGQLVTGLPSLKKHAKMSIQSVRTSLEKLKSTGQITVKTTNRFSIISICNYEKYQETATDKSTGQATDKQQTSNRQATTTKEYKKERIEEAKNNTNAHFDRFWSEYPKKKAKEDARRAFRKVPAAMYENLFLGLARARASLDWKKDNGQFIPYPATWLNGKRWEDEEVKRRPKIGEYDYYK